MEIFKVSNFLDTEHTIAKYMFESDSVQNPWEILPSIAVFIEALGPSLPEEVFEKVAEIKNYTLTVPEFS